MKNTKLKLFPLNIVAYPTKKIPLHIFEEKYKKLVAACIQDDREFGIILNNTNSLEDIGCSVKIHRLIKQYEDGTMDIVVIGETIFRLTNQNLVDDIIVGDIDYLPDLSLSGNKNFEALKVKYLQIIISLTKERDLNHHMTKSSTFELLEMFQLPIQIEQSLISERSEENRIFILDKYFSSILANEIFIKNSQYSENEIN